MPMSIERGFPGLAFGSVVRGLTMDDVRDEAVRSQLWNIFIEDGMIVFCDTDVTAEMHVEVSKIFGDLAIHPLAAHLGVKGHPELIQLKHDPETETIYDVDGERLGGYVPWHFDGVFVEKINRGGVLRIKRLPESGGATGFVDGIDAYATLPDRLRDRIQNLGVAYQLGSDFPYVPRNRIRVEREGEIVRKSRLRVEKGDFPHVIHPLVYAQKETGRKVLNFSPMFAKFVPGLSPAESHDLLTEISYHITDERRAYFHDWKSTDELVLWDNWRMLHKASGVPADARREITRTTIAGDYGLGQLAEPEARSAVNVPSF